MTLPARVDQLTAGFADGDAISTEALLLRDHLRGLGVASEIFVDPAYVTPRMREQCRPHMAYRGDAADVLIYHFSIGSAVTETYRRTSARRVMRYHNITPAFFFRGFDDRVAEQLRVARAELEVLAHETDAVWAVSQYNASEMAAFAGSPASVLPLLYAPPTQAPDPAVQARFSGGMTNILFVGRIAPNKRIEDLIQAFAWYGRAINRFSRLILVGSDRSCPRYYTMLRMLTGELDLPNVCFEGFVAPDALPSYYAVASVFVCASEHEGYCLPLVEAMQARVPVIAREAGGTPEALGGGGVLYEGLSDRQLAELIGLVVHDGALRAEVLAAQDARMRALAARDVLRELRDLLAALPQRTTRGV